MSSKSDNRLQARCFITELLERRFLFATVNVFSESYDNYTPTLASGVSATVSTTSPTGPYGSGGTFVFAGSGSYDSATLTLHGVPAHTMANISFDWEVEPGSGHGEDGSSTSKLVVTSGTMSETVEASNDQDTNPEGDPYYSETGNQGRWFADSGTTMTIDTSAPNFPADGDVELLDISVSVYTPTVSISGGGMTDELNATPTGFTVTRDAPSSYNATYDAPIPAIDVQLDTPTGTATNGVDYSTLPTHISIPESSSSTGTASISVTPIDDAIAEGDESIFLSVKSPTLTSPYILAAVPATAPTTNAATQRVDIVDNPSVSSITVSVDTSDPHETKAGDFYFGIKIVITGEALDKVYLNQFVTSSTTTYTTGGSQMSRDDTLAAYGYPFENDGVLIDTNGVSLQDTGYDVSQAVELDPASNKGIATVYDTQGDSALGGEAVPFGTGNTHIHQEDFVTRDYHIVVTDSSTHAVLKTADWGYHWSNANAYWSTAAGAPYTLCVADSLGDGAFDDVYGIDGIASV